MSFLKIKNLSVDYKMRKETVYAAKNVNIDVNKDKSLKQSNKLSQSRAKWLKSRVDDLFYM